MKKVVFYLFLFLGIFLLLSYKLLEVPPGLDADESSIGYNAILISENLKDENNHFHPVFILTMDGKDWKQPITIYSTAFLFKILGRSFFNLRLVSVLFALASCFLFFLLLKLFFSEKQSLIGLILFVSSPSILLHSHLAMENIALLPLFLFWLYLLLSYSIQPEPWKIFLSGITIGLSFYSYKGMHAMVPVYFLLSLIYLTYLGHFKKAPLLRPVFLFLLGSTPFLLPIKRWQTYYAGAVYDPSIVSIPSFFNAAYTYFSSFDFSFLFVAGEQMSPRMTGYYGMFLIPTIILFFLGLLQLVRERKLDYYFILTILLLTPLPLVLVGSVHRASRLLPYIPLVTFILTLGAKRVLGERSKYLRRISAIFFIIVIAGNYINFAKYYWYEYPKVVSKDFSPNINLGMKNLLELTKKEVKIPYVEYNDFRAHKVHFQFIEKIYFPDGNLKTWNREKDQFPQDGLILTSIAGSGNIVNYQEIPSLQSGQQAFYIVGEK
jgi:hypothetical protein